MSLFMSALKSQIADSKDPITKEDRQKWLEHTAASIHFCWLRKYQAGDEAHGGKDLGAITIESLLNEMEAEALDQLSYVREIKRRLNVNSHV